MDRFESDNEHCPVVDKSGKMISLDTVSNKKARVARDAAIVEEHKRTMKS